MPDFDPKAVDWGRVFAEAVLLAQVVRPRDAEDIVTEGMTLLLDGTAPFDAAGTETLAQHLVEAGLRAWRNRERTERRRRRPDKVAKLVQYLDEAPPTPEELNEERDTKARAFEELRAETADDPEVHAIVELIGQGVHEPAIQAQRLGWGIEVVRKARKRLTRRVKARAGSPDDDDEEEDEEPP
jgi:hypothetical protein